MNYLPEDTLIDIGEVVVADDRRGLILAFRRETQACQLGIEVSQELVVRHIIAPLHLAEFIALENQRIDL